MSLLTPLLHSQCSSNLGFDRDIYLTVFKRVQNLIGSHWCQFMPTVTTRNWIQSVSLVSVHDIKLPSLNQHQLLWYRLENDHRKLIWKSCRCNILAPRYLKIHLKNANYEIRLWAFFISDITTVFLALIIMGLRAINIFRGFLNFLLPKHDMAQPRMTMWI